jgi:hypothetical protein
MATIRTLWSLVAANSIRLQADYIRGLLNTTADQLSRAWDPTDWQLDPRVFRIIDHLWGPHTIDRFATVHNRQLVRFNSERHEPQTESVDAFTQDWSKDVNWLNPPWRLLPRVIDTLIRIPAPATLLVPVWPSQSWWPRLVSIASAVRLLPADACIFRHGSSARPEPLRNRFWRVALVRVNPSGPQLSWTTRARLFLQPASIALPGEC